MILTLAAKCSGSFWTINSLYSANVLNEPYTGEAVSFAAALLAALKAVEKSLVVCLAYIVVVVRCVVLFVNGFSLRFRLAKCSKGGYLVVFK